MSYFDKFSAAEEKMDNLLAKNELLYYFDTESYPITLTVRPNNTPDAQIALFERSQDGVSSSDAKLVFQFLVGEIGVRVYGRLIISDALMGKIKNQGKKMRDLWLQGDFAARAEQAGCLGPVHHQDDEGGQKAPDFREFFESDEDDQEE